MGPKRGSFVVFYYFFPIVSSHCCTSVFQSRLGKDQSATAPFLQKCLDLEFHISNFLLLSWGSRLVLKQKEAAGNLVSMLEGYQCKGSQINLTVDTPALKEPEECLQGLLGISSRLSTYLFEYPEVQSSETEKINMAVEGLGKSNAGQLSM